jgi:hypothetical protein
MYKPHKDGSAKGSAKGSVAVPNRFKERDEKKRQRARNIISNVSKLLGKTPVSYRDIIYEIKNLFFSGLEPHETNHIFIQFLISFNDYFIQTTKDMYDDNFRGEVSRTIEGIFYSDGALWFFNRESGECINVTAPGTRGANRGKDIPAKGPNKRFRSFLTHILLNLNDYTEREKYILSKYLHAFEDDRITGEMYIPVSNRIHDNLAECVALNYLYRDEDGEFKYTNGFHTAFDAYNALRSPSEQSQTSIDDLIDLDVPGLTAQEGSVLMELFRTGYDIQRAKINEGVIIDGNESYCKKDIPMNNGVNVSNTRIHQVLRISILRQRLREAGYSDELDRSLRGVQAVVAVVDPLQGQEAPSAGGRRRIYSTRRRRRLHLRKTKVTLYRNKHKYTLRKFK